MSTQTMKNNYHKYPEPLPVLPEQIVTAKRMIEYIEKDAEVSIGDVVYEYMQQHFPNGPPYNLTSVGEAVVEKLRRHPSLWYKSPNYTCIGEYCVQGYEWMKFIWYIRNICNICQRDYSLETDDEDNVFAEEVSVKAEFENETIHMKINKDLDPSNLLIPKTPPIEELIGNRSHTPPPLELEVQQPIKKMRFDETILDLL